MAQIKIEHVKKIMTSEIEHLARKKGDKIQICTQKL